MGFAEKYLQNRALKGTLICDKPAEGLSCIVVIPAYNESRLTRCLDSLFNCSKGNFRSEVLILINSADGCTPKIKELNDHIHREIIDWRNDHYRGDILFHVIRVSDIPAKSFGAGYARKLAMDEAVRRFNYLENPNGIILSLDADTLVDKKYLSEVNHFFRDHPRIEGCSIAFAHPLDGTDYPPEIYTAITNYELHLRYYLQGIRFAGYTYAYHTIGSCFAVTAGAYCKYGGMNKRQAGEDFYFIQKIAMNGKYSECNSTTVQPSPRPSDRVPFGTGPDVARQITKRPEEYYTFNPDLFAHLKAFYNQTDRYFRLECPAILTGSIHPILQEYLAISGYESILSEINANVSSLESFRKRFLSKFNMFWILKYLHFAEERGTKKEEIGAAARILLSRYNIPVKERKSKELLQLYRKIQSGLYPANPAIQHS